MSEKSKAKDQAEPETTPAAPGPGPQPAGPSEDLVVIGTYADLRAADAAHLRLMSAGLQALVFTSAPPAAGGLGGSAASPVSLAVHHRDAEIASRLLDPPQPHS